MYTFKCITSRVRIFKRFFHKRISKPSSDRENFIREFKPERIPRRKRSHSKEYDELRRISGLKHVMSPKRHLSMNLNAIPSSFDQFKRQLAEESKITSAMELLDQFLPAVAAEEFRTARSSSIFTTPPLPRLSKFESTVPTTPSSPQKSFSSRFSYLSNSSSYPQSGRNRICQLNPTHPQSKIDSPCLSLSSGVWEKPVKQTGRSQGIREEPIYMFM